MKKHVHHRRWLRLMPKISVYVHKLFQRGKFIAEDLRKLGFEGMKGGMTGLVVNGFVSDSRLFAASFLMLLIGAVIWIVALFYTEPDR